VWLCVNSSLVTMSAHITATVRACFAALGQICSVRCSLTQDALMTMDCSPVITKLDFCCSVLAGVSGSLMQWPQSVLNPTARLVFSARSSQHTTPLLRELHWLKVPERIQFRLRVLAHRCIHGTAPPYLAESLHLTTDDEARHHLRSASTSTLFMPSTRRSTLGDRAFPVAAARAWNNLPSGVRSTTSLAAFRQQFKTVIFEVSCG